MTHRSTLVDIPNNEMVDRFIYFEFTAILLDTTSLPWVVGRHSVHKVGIVDTVGNTDVAEAGVVAAAAAAVGILARRPGIAGIAGTAGTAACTVVGLQHLKRCMQWPG